MPRFFVSPDKIAEDTILITGDDAHHISYSLRMACGDDITVCDGTGMEYLCELSRFDGDTVTATVKSKAHSKSESPVKITLYQAYPKGDKLETIIQKSVELGAVRIVPFESERCIKRPKGDKVEKQRERMNKIAHEAAKQCGRAVLPDVSLPMSFSAAIDDAKKSSLSIFCYEDCHTNSLRHVLKERGTGVDSISVIIGSEGGFSEREAREIEEKGIIPVTLGSRILRCETAPVFALSAIAYFYEL